MRHFAFLEKEYGFLVEGPELHGLECSIHYVKAPALAIAVLSEPGSRPWVRITINEDGKPQELALEEFLKRYCPADSSEARVQNTSAESEMATYAAAIRKCGAALARP